MSAGQQEQHYYSGLEVVPQTPGLEVAPNHGLEVAPTSGLEVDYSRSQWVEGQPNPSPNVVSPASGPIPWETKTPGDGYPPGYQEQEPPPPPKTICGLRKRTFWIVAAIVIVIVIGAAVGGGVGGSIAARNRAAASTSAPAHNKTSPVYENSTLSTVQWKDGPGTTVINHYRVYFQAKDGAVLEAAWNSNTTGWNVTQITDPGADVVMGTPLTAATGYPHVNRTWDIVKNVYFIGNSGTMYERQSPYKEQEGVWGNDNFSGLYSTSSGSDLLSYWDQNFTNQTQILVVMFQEIGANSLTIGKYTSNKTSDNPWVDTRESISIQDGSPLAVAATGVELNLRLYLASSEGFLTQYAYQLDAGSLTQPKSTTFKLTSHTPLAVSTQDNTGFFTEATRPECTKDSPWTHLILFASPERTSLSLVAWNCSSGFVEMKAEIAPMLKPDRTYLGLAAHTDSRMYVLFDAGDGPEIEEWQVPLGGQHGAWSVVGPVPVALTPKTRRVVRKWDARRSAFR